MNGEIEGFQKRQEVSHEGEEWDVMRLLATKMAHEYLKVWSPKEKRLRPLMEAMSQEYGEVERQVKTTKEVMQY